MKKSNKKKKKKKNPSICPNQPISKDFLIEMWILLLFWQRREKMMMKMKMKMKMKKKKMIET